MQEIQQKFMQLWTQLQIPQEVALWQIIALIAGIVLLLLVALGLLLRSRKYFAVLKDIYACKENFASVLASCKSEELENPLPLSPSKEREMCSSLGDFSYYLHANMQRAIDEINELKQRLEQQVVAAGVKELKEEIADLSASKEILEEHAKRDKARIEYLEKELADFQSSYYLEVQDISVIVETTKPSERFFVIDTNEATKIMQADKGFKVAVGKRILTCLMIHNGNNRLFYDPASGEFFSFEARHTNCPGKDALFMGSAKIIKVEESFPREISMMKAEPVPKESPAEQSEAE